MALSLVLDRLPTGSLPDTVWMVYATRWVSPGVSFMPESEYKYLVGISEDEDTYEAGSNYVALFGEPPVGTKIFIRSFLISDDTGLASTPINQTAIVAV